MPKRYDNPLIGVLAGNKGQFQDFVKKNIRPITSLGDYQLAKGVQFDHIIEVGTWYHWCNEQTLKLIQLVSTRKD